MTLPTNRTTANTAAEHVADHNTLHGEFNVPTHTHSGAYVAATGDTAGSPRIVATNAAAVPLTVKGAAAQTADLVRWTNENDTALAKIDAAGRFGIDPWNGVGGALAASLFAGVSNAAGTGIVVRALGSQTGDLQQWQDSGGAPIAKVGPAGTVTPLVSTTAARPSAATAGAGAMYYDTTLSKPVWSNGTVWKDAAGTTV